MSMDSGASCRSCNSHTADRIRKDQFLWQSGEEDQIFCFSL
jgi:hypothetical protein